MSTAPLALTMGEPGGVGPEITCAAWSALRNGQVSFFVLADPALFRSERVDVKIIRSPAEASASFGAALPVLPLKCSVNSTIGVAEPQNASAVIESIEKAVSLTLAGKASGVVTNPIQKSSLIQHGFKFPGHTEFLAELTKNAKMPADRARGPVMMIAGPTLRTVPVTIHQSVKAAVSLLSADLIIKICTVAAQSLKHDFGVQSPRLAVSGLNPHAGEAGAIGTEDAEIITPALKALRESGIEARGPLPADTMFHEEARARYDAAICMLHDQALIPAKTLAFHEAVNVTLGLPIIRTSPDHGTALDIAGKGVARADSLIAAIRLAAQIAERRGAI
jgi:4-hydroxythreonine-4-phosphate dehydrogenase